MSEFESAVEALARLLVEAESDDQIDIVAAIEAAPPDVRAAVAEVQRQRIAQGAEG